MNFPIHEPGFLPLRAARRPAMTRGLVERVCDGRLDEGEAADLAVGRGRDSAESASISR